jgi:hypothetical protein
MLDGGKRKGKHEKKRKTASCWRDAGEKVCTCEHEHEQKFSHFRQKPSNNKNQRRASASLLLH